MSSWRDKVVVVTGGSSGLGLAIAKAYCGQGARVVLVGRDQQRLAAAVEQVRASGGEVSGFPADVTQQCEVDDLFVQIHETFGRLDVLVNNAGRSNRGAILDTTPDDFAELLDLNFLAVVHCTRAAAPALLQSRGHLVNIGSLAGKQAPRFMGAYPVSKFALAAYSQQLRLELGPQGLHVLLVSPGPLERPDAGTRYESAAERLPESAGQPGGGVKLKRISPDWLAQRIVRACERRRAELIVPGRARWLCAIASLWPEWGDRILLKNT